MPARVRVAGRGRPALVLMSLALTTGLGPASANAESPVVFSASGDPLAVGSVVARGTVDGDLCSFAGGDYVVTGNTAVVLAVTPDCELVIRAIERLDGVVSGGAPRGPVVPRRPADLSSTAEPAGTGSFGVAIGGGVPVVEGPDRLESYRGHVANYVSDEAGVKVFFSNDEIDFTQNARTGALGNVRYREGWCEGTPYVALDVPPVHADVPFQNTVVTCDYDSLRATASRVQFTSRTEYRQTTGPGGPLLTSVERARFTVRNNLVVYPDDGDSDTTDFTFDCPVVAGSLPNRQWQVRCEGGVENVTIT